MRNEAGSPKVFSRAQARVKAESYCAYQERSQYEVRNKLYEWGLHQKEVEEIISELIESNFLNEERFALAYTLGKFRIKGWGKIKIKQGLKLKRVPDKMIAKSLKAIDPDDYIAKLKSLIEKKAATLREPDPYKMRYLLGRFAASKGFEQDLISDILKD
ncbi:regulatory protein RecX [Daejeonella sp. JGW-45]|uniref:regulatory protein RecX n=1 Tax=Daejeonella sp. JGW-45 TaxID=3034148 RepID=UPI0023EC1E75|nr:regulatory protein RecX [Daejeonella sp. JGW-45]